MSPSGKGWGRGLGTRVRKMVKVRVTVTAWVTARVTARFRVRFRIRACSLGLGSGEGQRFFSGLSLCEQYSESTSQG